MKLGMEMYSGTSNLLFFQLKIPIDVLSTPSNGWSLHTPNI